jgi:hypothetical protein
VSFVADQEACRTYDDSGGAELMVLSCGSGGQREFELRMADRSVRFIAHTEAAPKPNEDKLDWRVKAGLPEDWAMISEALLAFGLGHGFWADKVRTVLFLEQHKRFFRTSYEWVDA